MLPVILKVSRMTPRVTTVPRFIDFLVPKRAVGALPPSALASDDVSDPTIGQNFEDLSRKHTKELQIQSKLKCTEEQAKKLLNSSTHLKELDHNDIGEVLKILLNCKVPPGCIMENPWLLLQRHHMLGEKISSLIAMQPKELSDFIPLLRISKFSLMKLVRKYKDECSIVPKKHRVYFMSNQLKIEPQIVAKYLSMRQFIFFMPFSTLHEILSMLLKSNVEPMSILKDLWVFRYKPRAVEMRLNYVKTVQEKKPMPWMVRCPTSILDQTLKITQDNRAILGRNETVVDYLSERLGYDIQILEYITSKHPAVLRVNMTKIKEIMDYLLIDAGFLPQDIVQVPRILCHSIETIRTRIEQLKSYGCMPSTLSIVCRSQREYEKFLDNWLSTRERLGLVNKSG